MAHKVKYGVQFVGYLGRVIAKKGHREIEYAQLDFVTGLVYVRADQGSVSSRFSNLGSFVQTLPKLRTELWQRLCPRSEPSLKETGLSLGGEMVHLSYGEIEICASPQTNVDKFIQQVTKRYFEIEPVLEQAELVGSRIKRRPYDEYIDEIRKTGLCRVEGHGFALFLNGKLTFYPNYQVALVKPEGSNVFRVHVADPNPESGGKTN